jgi:hypothetical protein
MRRDLCSVDVGKVAACARDAAEDRLAFAIPAIQDTARNIALASPTPECSVYPFTSTGVVAGRNIRSARSQNVTVIHPVDTPKNAPAITSLRK